ncbi:hypothetical protein G9O61_00g015430 [Vairimorpha ceranae]|nr:hypothetical protein G9O61_00g015430 [Vairimorpha ceranae]
MNCLLLISIIFACNDKPKYKLYDEILQHSSKPNYTIDTANESIHVVIICKDYIYIKFIELRKEVKTEIILIEEKNKTLINLNNILLDFFGELSQKTLVISTSSDAFKICPKDIEIVFGRNYKQVIVGYSVLNGPKKYRESNCVGLILNQNELSIQYHKYDDNIMNLYILPINEKSFFHKYVCDFLLCHPLTYFNDKEFTDRFIQQSSLYNFLFDHLHQFKKNQNVNDFISIDKHLITLTINKNPFRSVRIKENCAILFKNFDKIVANKFTECNELWNVMHNFFTMYTKTHDNFNHSLTFLYNIIRFDNKTYSFLLLKMVSDKNLIHFSLVIIISYLLSIISQDEAHYLLEHGVDEKPKTQNCIFNVDLVDTLMKYNFCNNSPIFLLFKLLLVDAACQELAQQDNEIIKSHKAFEIISSLCEFAFFDKKEISFLDSKKYEKSLSLFWCLFYELDPLYELRDAIFFSTLYVINRFILKNDKFYFYSNSFINYTAKDEVIMKLIFYDFN